MIDADLADAAAFATTGKANEVGIETKNFVEASPIDQYAQIKELLGGHEPYADRLYVADMYDAGFTEVGRLGIIEWCLEDKNIFRGKEFSANVVKWAICQHDIDVFDRKKFDAQLRTDTSHNAGERMVMRLRVVGLPKLLKEHAELVQKA